MSSLFNKRKGVYLQEQGNVGKLKSSICEELEKIVNDVLLTDISTGPVQIERWAKKIIDRVFECAIDEEDSPEYKKMYGKWSSLSDGFEDQQGTLEKLEKELKRTKAQEKVSVAPVVPPQQVSIPRPKEKCKYCWFVIPASLAMATKPYKCRICECIHYDKDSMRTLKRDDVAESQIKSQKALAKKYGKPKEGEKFEAAMKKYRMKDIRDEAHRRELSPFFKNKRGEYDSEKRT